MTKSSLFTSIILLGLSILTSCNNADTSKANSDKEVKTTQSDTAEYFNLRPKLEKDYGYSHAVRIGNDLKITGAVSMDDSGTIVAPGNMEQQMKNCYSDLEKILKHYGYTYDRSSRKYLYNQHGRFPKSVWLSEFKLQKTISNRDMA